MKKIRFPRIRKGYGKLVSVLRRRGGRKRTEQLPAMLLEAERCEDEQLAVMQCEDERREVGGCEDEQHEDEQREAVQCEAGGCEDERHEAGGCEDEQHENEHHGKAEACNQQQCSLREFCLKKFSEKRDAHAAGGASPDKAKR